MLKQILIPVAALAITVTSASAFTGGDMLSKLNIDLSDSETAALQTAHEIRTTAHKEANQVLEEAGITDERLSEIREAMHKVHRAEHEAMKAALEANDYEAFKTAVADSPVAESIDSTEKFAKMVEAHKLMNDGDHDGAKAIMEELGLKGPGVGGKGMGGGRDGDRPNTDN